jgi:hypothetical protein
MKKLSTILAVVLITTSVFAQAPQKMSYQAVIRNSGGTLVTNQGVGMRVSISTDSTFAIGNINYREIYNPNPTTNANGLVTIEVGGGLALIGTFAGINWANGTYYIKTETDPTGGTTYTINGKSQLLSVPYALCAGNVTNYTGGTGINVTGTTITNTAPDQTVAITGTGHTTVSGTYPTFTVNTPNYTAGTGISIAGGTVTNTAPDQTVAITGGTGINVTGTYPNFTVTNTAPESTPRIVYGNDGGGGSGYTVSSSGGGLTYLNFNTPFSSPPMVTATLINVQTGAGTPFVGIQSVSTSQVIIITGYTSNSGSFANLQYVNYSFNFIAVGN